MQLLTERELAKWTKAELIEHVLQLEARLAASECRLASSSPAESAVPLEGQRILFELLTSSERQPRVWSQVQAFISSMGGTVLDSPTGNPPYLIRAIVPIDADVSNLLARLRLLEGVGRADPDALSEAF